MMNDYLSKQWKYLSEGYSGAIVNEIKQKLVDAYSEEHRKYHTLKHLEHIFIELGKAHPQGIDEATQWAVWYHDIIYQPGKSNNEENSAKVLRKDLEHLGVEQAIIDKSYEMIIATQKHLSDDDSTWIFLDADMAILGTPQETYSSYLCQVREEFKKIPNVLYKRGRKKFLRTTLEKSRIFYSNYFYKQYEVQARENLKYELNIL